MKAMTKQQLAECAGVSVRTLMRWCNRYKDQLQKYGVEDRSKVLPAPAVKFIVEKLCIDLQK